MVMGWKKFIERQSFPTIFLYRPVFRKTYPQFEALPLPMILVEKQGRLEVLVLAGEIESAAGVTALIKLVEVKLETWRAAMAKRTDTI